jgi:hypothetical protein
MDRTMLQRLAMGTIVVALVGLAAILLVPQLRGAGGGGAADTASLDLAAQPSQGQADAPV